MSSGWLICKTAIFEVKRSDQITRNHMVILDPTRPVQPLAQRKQSIFIMASSMKNPSRTALASDGCN